MQESRKSFEGLEYLIVDWAIRKGLIIHTKEQAIALLTKTNEKVDELLDAISILESGGKDEEKALESVRLEAGHVFVTLVILSAISGSTLQSALKPAGNPLSYPTLKNSCSTLGSELELTPPGNRIYRIAQVARAVERKIAPYDLTLHECLREAWRKILNGKD